MQGGDRKNGQKIKKKEKGREGSRPRPGFAGRLPGEAPRGEVCFDYIPTIEASPRQPDISITAPRRSFLFNL